MRFQGGVTCALLALVVVGVAPGQGPALDLASVPAGAAATYFASMSGGQLGTPIDVGDFDGDGHADVACSPFFANTMDRLRNGIIAIVFGDGTVGGEIDFENYAGRRLLIHGGAENSVAGLELLVADMDKDGHDDLILSTAHGTDEQTFIGDGEIVILYGRAEWGTAVREMDLGNLPPEQRRKVFAGRENPGGTHGARLGAWYDVADFDGNGKLDIVTGMDSLNGPGGTRSRAGAMVVIWDAHHAYPEQPFLVVGGSPQFADAFTIIHGRDAGDMMGATVLAGDVDGDGTLDIVASSGVTRSGLQIAQLNWLGSGGGDGPANNRSNAGETTIFWDAGRLRAVREVDLVTMPNPDITTIHGERATGYFGEELFLADMTGDGRNDLIVGGLTIGVAVSNGGAAYVFTRTDVLRTMTMVDLLQPPLDFVVAIDGGNTSGWGGDTIEAFDINLDGIADLFFAIPAGTPMTDRHRAGFVTVILGGQDFPTMPDRVLAGRANDPAHTTPPLRVATIMGVDGGDLLAYSTAMGDINGDGVVDYLAAAMQGDGFMNSRPNAGEYYVVDGLHLARHTAQPRNVRVRPEPGVLLAWEAGEVVFGGTLGYDVDVLLPGAAEPIAIRIHTTELAAGDVPPGATVVGVRAVQQSVLADEVTSLAVPVQVINDPIGADWIIR